MLINCATLSAGGRIARSLVYSPGGDLTLGRYTELLKIFTASLSLKL